MVLSHQSRANTAFNSIDTDFTVPIPMHPFFGCIGVAPASGEALSSIVPAEFGGNIDSPEASVGNTVYFPVNVKGGLLYLGDGHRVGPEKRRVSDRGAAQGASAVERGQGTHD